MRDSAPPTLPDLHCELPPPPLPGGRPLPHVDPGPARASGPVVVATAAPPPLRAAHSRQQPGSRDAEDTMQWSESALLITAHTCVGSTEQLDSGYTSPHEGFSHAARSS